MRNNKEIASLPPEASGTSVNLGRKRLNVWIVTIFFDKSRDRLVASVHLSDSISINACSNVACLRDWLKVSENNHFRCEFNHKHVC